MKFVQKSDISSFNILAIPDAPYYSDQLGVACVQFRVAQSDRVRLHQVYIHTHIIPPPPSLTDAKVEIPKGLASLPPRGEGKRVSSC